MELHELRNSVELALDMVHATRDILAAEVCASWCEQQVVRLRHDTEHPSEDVQALQAHTTYGLSFLVVMADSNGRTVGFGVTSEDLSRDGILTALDMARQGAAPEPLRFTFPRPLDLEPPPIPLHDPQMLTLPDDEIASGFGHPRRGTLDLTRGWLCQRSARQWRGPEPDRASGHWQYAGLVGQRYHHGPAGGYVCAARATAESGTGSRVATHWRDFAAYEAGVEAAQQALRAQGSITLAGGDYPVVFGPRAVAALVQDLYCQRSVWTPLRLVPVLSRRNAASLSPALCSP